MEYPPTVTADNQAEFDLKYEAGMSHLQAGEWEEAIRSFEELASQHPDSALAQSALSEAQYKASLDTPSRRRSRLWSTRWRPMLARVAFIAAFAGLVAGGARLAVRQVGPALAQAQTEGQQAQLLTAGNAFRDAGDWDAANDSYNKLLTQAPGHEQALAGLEDVAARQELQKAYEEGVALQEAGDWDRALERLIAVSEIEPRYLDVGLRIAAIRRTLEMQNALASADDYYESGQTLEAISAYEQVIDLAGGDIDDAIADRLAELHIRAARALVDSDPLPADAVQEAIDHYRQALALRPRNAEATAELRLALLFVEGRALYNEEQWVAAAALLGALYDERPDEHWAKLIINMLYEAYVRSGDGYREAGDSEMAFYTYQKACELPAADTELACARMLSVSTPTPRPTLTPVPEAVLAPVADYVDVRSGAGYDFRVLGRIERGAQSRISGRHEDWWQIEFDGGRGWVPASEVTAFYADRAPEVMPTASAPFYPQGPPATPTATSTAPAAEARGLAVVAYYVPRAPGPFGPGTDIWFNFSITNESDSVVSYSALGMWVEETGQFQKSWTFSVLTPGANLNHRDHINIQEPGTYNLWLAIQFSDGMGVLLRGPVNVVVQ